MKGRDSIFLFRWLDKNVLKTPELVNTRLYYKRLKDYRDVIAITVIKKLSFPSI